MNTRTLTLAEAYPIEQARCRELLEQYAEIAKMPNVNVSFAVYMIKAVLQEADYAAAAHDTVRMLRAYEAMKECQ